MPSGDDTHEPGFSYHGIRIIGAVNELQPLLERNALDEIAITLPLSQYEKLKNIVSICEKSGVHTKFIPDYYGVIPTIPYMEDVAGMPVINIRHVPLTEFYNAAAKRLVDIIGGIVGLVVFSLDATAGRFGGEKGLDRQKRPAGHLDRSHP